LKSVGGIVVTGSVFLKGGGSAGGIFAASGVSQEGADSAGDIKAAGGVGERAATPLPVLALPVLLLKRAPPPLAVLLIPILLLERAPAPSAVLALLLMVVLVRGVQVAPMVAFDPRHVSFPAAAAAIVAFASAMSKNDTTRMLRLSGLFMAFSSKSIHLDSSLSY
jgi:hypothetical protein